MHKEWKRAAARGMMAALAACALPLAAQAQAQAWPAHPLKLIVPFGPGSSPDQVARVVGVQLGRELVVDLGLDRVGMHRRLLTALVVEESANQTPHTHTHTHHRTHARARQA